MALSEAKIRKIIQLTLQVDPASKEGNALIQETLRNLKSLHNYNTILINDSRLMGNAAKEQALLVRTANGGLLKLAQNTDKVQKSTVRLTEHLGKLSTTLRGIGVLGSIDILEGFAFEKAIKYVTEFNKSLVILSGQFSKYGQGVDTVEKKLQNLASTVTLTRKDTMALMAAYERGFNYASFENGAKLMNNLRGAVGANVSAMKEMQDFLSGIIQKFPDLERSVTRLNSFDKQRLIIQSQMLTMTGQISLADGKRLRDYAYQNAQATSADEKRLAVAKDEIEAINKLEAAVERVAKIVGDELTPYVVKLANWIDGTKGKWETWISPLTKIGLILGGIEATVLTIKGVKLLANSLGAANLLGEYAGVGGAAGARVKSFLTPQWGGGLQPGANGRWWGTPTNQKWTAGRALNIGGNALKGGAAAYGAGALYDEGYQMFTGRELSKDTSNTGLGNRMAKVGGMAATGLAFGGLPGAAAGAVIGSGQEAYRTYSDINKMRAESSEMERKSLIALTKEAQRFNEESGKATSQGEKDFYVKKQQANELRKAGRYAEASAKEQEAAKGEWFQGIESQRKASEAANASVKAPQTHGDISDLISQYSNARQDGGQAISEFFKSSFSTIQKKMDNADVANVLGTDKNNPALSPIQHLIGGGPIKSGSDDMLKVGMVNDEAVKRMDELKQAGQENTQEYKNQEAAAKATKNQLDMQFKTTSGIVGEFEQLAGLMNEAKGTAEQALKTFESQRSVLSAMADKQFLMGNSSFNSETEQQSKEALESYKTAAMLSHQMLDIEKQQNDLFAQRIAREIALKEAAIKNEPDKNKASGMRDEVAELKLKQAKFATASSLAGAAGIAQQRTVEENELKNIISLTMTKLANEDKLVEVTRSHTAQLQSQLQLQMQYGNSVAANVNTTLQLVDANQKTYEQLSKELTILQNRIKLEGTNKEYEQKEQTLLTQINQVRSEGLQIMQNMANINKANVDYATAQSDQLEAMISLQDNLAMGVAASANTRMKAAESIGQIIKEEQVNLDAMKATLSAGLPAMKAQAIKEGVAPEDADRVANERLLSVKTQIVQKNTTMLQLMQKQATLTRSIRDGWISSIQAMTAGTGIFSKLMISQEKNLGIGVTYMKGFVQSMRSGGVDLSGERSVGQRQSARFGLGGIEGKYDPSRRPDTFDGGGAIAQGVGSIQERAKRFLAQRNASITSQTAGAFGAAPQQGAVLQGNMTAGPNKTGAINAPVAPTALSQQDTKLTTVTHNDAPEMKLWKKIAQSTMLSEQHLEAIQKRGGGLGGLGGIGGGAVAGGSSQPVVALSANALSPSATNIASLSSANKPAGKTILGPSAPSVPLGPAATESAEDSEMKMWKNLVGKRADGKTLSELRAMFGKDTSASPMNKLQEKLTRVQNAKQYNDLDTDDRKLVWKEEDRLDKKGLTKNTSAAGRQQMAVWGVKFDREAALKKEMASLGKSVSPKSRDITQRATGKSQMFGPAAPEITTREVAAKLATQMKAHKTGGLINGMPAELWRHHGNSAEFDSWKKNHSEISKNTINGVPVDSWRHHGNSAQFDAWKAQHPTKPMTVAGKGNQDSGGGIHLHMPVDISKPMAELTSKFHAMLNELKRGFRGNGLESSSTGGGRFS